MVAQFPTLALQIHRSRDIDHEDQKNNTYSFVLMDEVDVEKNLIWHDTQLSVTELLKFRQALVSRNFETIDTVPPWRLAVSPTEHGSHVTFNFHHALTDGTGALGVLFAIRDALNSSPPVPNINPSSLPLSIITIPVGTPLPTPVESHFELSVTAEAKAAFEAELAQTPGPADVQKLWTGSCPSSIDTSKGPPLQAQILMYTIPAASMKTLLQKSRENGATITGVLVATLMYATDIVLGSSGVNVPETQTTGLQTTVPQNLRTIIDRERVGSGPSALLMGDFVTATLIPYTRVVGAGVGVGVGADSSRHTDRSRSRSPDPHLDLPVDHDLAHLWSVSRSTSRTLKQKALNITTRTSNLGISFLPYLGCSVYEFQKRIRAGGKARANSFEVSSLVIPELPPPSLVSSEEEDSEPKSKSSSSSMSSWTLKDPIFIQAIAEGPAIALSAIGYRGGSQTMSFTWAAEVVENEIVEKIVDTFKDLIKSIVV